MNKVSDYTILEHLRAKSMYLEYTSNHTAFSSPQFPPWEELTEATKLMWLDTARQQG
jgi:hypothetical protein